jgi:hypothetical protein
VLPGSLETLLAECLVAGFEMVSMVVNRDVVSQALAAQYSVSIQVWHIFVVLSRPAVGEFVAGVPWGQAEKLAVRYS